MSLLYPLFLLAALAIAIPVALHLQRRPPARRVEFSSLMFLEAQPPRRDQRRKVEQLVLLLLRCLSVLLLALLFARPYWRGEEMTASGAANRLRLILVDRSASMRREGLWEEAAKAVREEVRRTGPGEDLGLLAFDGTTERLLDFHEWRELPVQNREAAVEERLRKLQPGWGGSDAGRALVQAVRMWEGEAAGQLRQRPAEVVVVSDWQSGASLAALEGYSWPEQVQVRRVTVRPPGRPRSNASLHLAGRAAREEADDGEFQGTRNLVPVRVRVSNGPGATQERFRLVWEGAGPARTVDVVLPAGSSRVVTAPPRGEHDSCLRLEGDEEPFDNRLYVAPDAPRPVRVLYLGNRVDEDDSAEPLFYLRRALNETRALRPEVRARSWDQGLAEALDWAKVVVLADEPPGVEVERLERFLRDGGTVWLPLRVGVDPGKLPLVRHWGVTIREAEPKDYALWSGLDFQHAMLRPFAPAALRDFSKIHVWHYRELRFPGSPPGGVEVLASFDQGGPALLWAEVEKGQIAILPSGWLPRDSQLALSSKFVPLLFALLTQAGFESGAKKQYFVGEEWPGGGKAREPGVVTAAAGGAHGEEGGAVLAINLPVAESELEPWDAGVLSRLGIGVREEAGDSSGEPAEEVRRRLQWAELEERQRGWRWLVLAALLVLLAETWLSARPPGRSPSPA